jgi:hypothetical protein
MPRATRTPNLQTESTPFASWTTFCPVWTPLFAASSSNCSSHSSTNILGFLTCRRGLSGKCGDGRSCTTIVELSGVFGESVISLNRRCLLPAGHGDGIRCGSIIDAAASAVGEILMDIEQRQSARVRRHLRPLTILLLAKSAD